MALIELFDTLDATPYGAYVMDQHRRIRFWNRSAERILGYRPEEVVGRQCYEALLGLPEQPTTPTCGPECLTAHLAEKRRLAPVAWVRMRCASGARKRVSVIALHVPNQDTSVLLHLFHERAGEGSLGRTDSSTQRGSALQALEGSPGSGGGPGYSRLTPREQEVVRLRAAGESVPAIGDCLYLSDHTVLNHIRNARRSCTRRRGWSWCSRRSVSVWSGVATSRAMSPGIRESGKSDEAETLSRLSRLAFHAN